MIYVNFIVIVILVHAKKIRGLTFVLTFLQIRV